jgi:hypothetical protein
MATHNAGRSSATYRAWVKQVLARCEPVCIRCGYPVDMALPRTDPQGASADHEPPLADTGDLTPGLDGAGIAHLSCNRSHGGRLGSARATAKRATAKSSNTRSNAIDRSLSKARTTPAAPALYPPKGAGKAKNAPVKAQTSSDGYILPRLETRAPERVLGSYGEGAAVWLREVYGMELRGWQRHALDRALEHDQEGQLVWPTVIITVGRQSGKSYLARAVCMWRLHHAELFGETQTIMHVANKRSTAMEVLRPAGLWAVERYGKKAARWGNENAGIELPSGDRWLVHAANDSAGVGYSVSMLFVDEAWKIKEEVVTASLAPTMAERNQGQMWLVSTAGDSTSDLMIGYRQRALDRLEATDPGSILLLEWSAPAEADPENEETWKFGSPEWSDKRRDFLAQQWNNVEESAFRQQYLNQWIVRANHWMKETWWKETLDAGVDLPDAATWSVAVESDFDGMGHAVAIAAPLEDGTIVVRATTHRTIKEVDERLAQIRKEHPSIYVQVTPGYVDRLRERFDSLVGQREAAAATQNLLDLFDRRAIRHDGSQVLQEHFAASTISRRQGGWVLTAPMGKGGVYAARAALFAMAQACKTPKPLAMIRSSKRRHA